MVYIIVACFILFDILTGLIKAFKNKDYKSCVMREGLFHKCGSLLCIVFGFLIDYGQQFLDLGFKAPVGTTICIYICLMEFVSIAENLRDINPELSKLLTILADKE